MARDFAAGTDGLTGSASTAIANGATSLSIALWVWPDNFTAAYKLIGQWNGNFDQSIFLIQLSGAGNNKPSFILTANASSQDSDRRSSGTLTSGQWNHVVCTWTATDTFTFYLDGSSSAPETWLTSEGISAAASSGSTPAITVGKAADGGSLDGKMAEVAVWKNYVITAPEASSLAKAYSPLFVNPSALSFMLQ